MTWSLYSPPAWSCGAALGSLLAAMAMAPPLELQPGFAGGIGERLDAAVIEIAVAVEHHHGDALLQQARRDAGADGLGGGGVAAVLELLAQLLLQRGRGGERQPARVVDGLGVDALEALVDGEARALGGAVDAAPDALLGLFAAKFEFVG